MAWSIPTYAGVRAIGQPSNFRLAMFELCRAINERETAMGAPVFGFGLTTFYKADGTQAANVSMSDLEFLPCSGANNLAQRNLEKIRGWITDTAPDYFTQGSGETPLVTESWLSTQVGYDLAQTCSKVNDAAHWQALQDALDLLVYPWGTWNPVAYAATIGRSETLAFHATIADAWADRNYQNTGTIVGWGLNSGAGVAAVSTGVGTWNAGYCSSHGWKLEPGVSTFRIGGTWQMNDLGAGVMVEARADYVIHGELLASDVAFAIGDDTGDITNGSTEADCEISSWSIGATGYVTATVTIPSALPLTEETHATTDSDRRLGIVYCDNVRTYYDITGELTDQAA